MPDYYAIQISPKQRNRLVEALREFNNAHPELPADNYFDLDTDHPESLANLLETLEEDGLNCLAM